MNFNDLIYNTVQGHITAIDKVFRSYKFGSITIEKCNTLVDDLVEALAGQICTIIRNRILEVKNK